MTNPTTPFSWQMPTATDLVTDLPADFETFGQAVATSMADLLGGTTGQILSKASNTDMDFTWITNDVGDITAVNTTAPLAGGGTSGALTLSIASATTSVAGAVQLSDSTSTTSSVLAATPTAVKSAYDLAAAAVPKSTVTTAGDVIYATGSGTVTRLGLGTAGQVLTVNTGATAPEWKTASGGSSFPAFSAYKSTTDQTGITSGTWAKVTFNSEDFDTNNNFASNAFTPTVAGYYQLNASVYADCSAAADSQIALYKNGTRYRRFSIRQIPATNASIVNGSILVYANGSTDYFEVYYRPDGGTSTVYAGIEITYFQGIGIRA